MRQAMTNRQLEGLIKGTSIRDWTLLRLVSDGFNPVHKSGFLIQCRPRHSWFDASAIMPTVAYLFQTLQCLD